MNQVFSVKLDSRERSYALSRKREKKKAYFTYVVRPFSFLKTSFLFNNLKTFNLRKYMYIFLLGK